MASPLSAIDIPPLDPGLLKLDQDESAFFKALTGIEDDDALKQHIIDVQTKAYKVFFYPCIRLFNFTKLKISRLPAYDNTTRLRDNYPDAILLDAGCCFGNDLRKAVLDGWPVQNTMGLDIEANFWKYGHELFKSSPDTFPAGFVKGDIFKEETLQSREPFYAEPSAPRPASLRDLQSLIPIQGHISAIHASSLFHIFNEDKQTTLAKRLASLLSPRPGSIIFGSHGGLPQKGLLYGRPDYPMFCHGPDTWKALWDGQVFKAGTVRVDVHLKEVERSAVQVFNQEEDTKYYLLVWSVTRL